MMVAAAISEGKLVRLLGGWALRMSGVFLYFEPPASVFGLLAKPMNGINAPKRSDCVAEVVGLELRNVIAKYAFESSHTAAAHSVTPLLTQQTSEFEARGRPARTLPLARPQEGRHAPAR